MTVSCNSSKASESVAESHAMTLVDQEMAHRTLESHASLYPLGLEGRVLNAAGMPPNAAGARHLLLPPSAPPLGAFALKLPSNPGLAFPFPSPFPFLAPDLPPFFPFSSFRFCKLASRFFCFMS